MKTLDPISSFRRWTRNSPWLVMSVLAHVIVFVCLGLVVMTHKRARQEVDRPDLIKIHNNEPTEEVFLPPEEITRSTRDVIPPDLIVELVDPDHADIPIPPDPTLTEEDLTKDLGSDIGNGIEFGGPQSATAIGVGIGPGHPGDGVTTTFRDRRKH